MGIDATILFIFFVELSILSCPVARLYAIGMMGTTVRSVCNVGVGMINSIYIASEHLTFFPIKPKSILEVIKVSSTTFTHQEEYQ